MKTVLIDFSHINSFCGFGEIARNYSRCLVEADTSDMHLVFLLPENMKGAFGDKYSYVSCENMQKDLEQLGFPIDLWHTTDQLFRYKRGGENTIQLLTVHDLNFLREKKHIHRLKHIFKTRWKVKKSDYVTVISHYVENDVRKYIGAKDKDIQVVYNGIADLETGNRVKPSFVKDDNEQFFFTIGQIREKKNFQKLVPMMKYLPEYKLYISGDDHFKYAQVIRNLIHEYGEGRVVLTGKITDDEKRWMYDHCQAFFFPSRLEGFGLPGLEAMRFRCKVFSSKFSSLPEVYGKYATYWDDYEPQAMAKVVRDGIASWSKDSDFATEMVQYSKGFNYQRYTEEYLSLYRKLLAEAK